VPKKPRRSPKTEERKHINSRKSQNRAGQGTDTAVRRAHRWSCVQARAWYTVLLSLPAVQGYYLRCTTVRPCCTAVSSIVLLCFASLDALGFLESLIFLEIALEVFFFIETQLFLLTRRQNTFQAQYKSKEDNNPCSTRFDIKLIRKRDQIRAKIGSNKGLTCVCVCIKHFLIPFFGVICIFFFP